MTKSKGKNVCKKLHAVHVEVLEGLALSSPRNLAKVAAYLDIPRETLAYRIKYLRSHFSLYLQGIIYHTNIGLRKVMVFAESRSGYEETLFQCFKANDYWLYVSRCIAPPKCIATFGIPAGKEMKFEEFLRKLENLDFVKDVDFFWCTSIHNVNTTSKWFDQMSEEWVFPWDSWVQEVQTCCGELPFTLKEPNEYVQKGDYIDIIILKELEKDCTVRFKTLAKMLQTTSQNVKYHFQKHIIKRQMFEGPQILADHYRGLSPDTFSFVFNFKNKEDFTKFALSLMDKPFVRAMGKAFGKNKLWVRIYLPRKELKNFTDTLSKLVKRGFLEAYEYMIEDAATTQRQTISYEYFKEDSWIYNHQKYLKRLQQLSTNV